MEATDLTQQFIDALSKTYWDISYVDFCQILELSDDEWSWEKFRIFQETVKNLNTFDLEFLSKLVEVGMSKK